MRTWLDGLFPEESLEPHEGPNIFAKTRRTKDQGQMGRGAWSAVVGTSMKSLISFLWTPGRRRLSLSLEGNADAAARRLAETLHASEEVTGRVAGRGVKIRRLPQKSRVRGIFASYFYGVFQENGADCRLVGHFQWHPVGRIYAAAWMALSGLVPLAFLVAGALRASPESTAKDALPFVIPLALPLLLTGMIYWQRRRDVPDEKAIRRWLDALKDGWQEIGIELTTPLEQEAAN